MHLVPNFADVSSFFLDFLQNTPYDVIRRHLTPHSQYINKTFQKCRNMLEKIVTVFYANWMIFDEDIGLKVQITKNSDTEKCKYADVSKKIVGMEL